MNSHVLVSFFTPFLSGIDYHRALIMGAFVLEAQIKNNRM